MIETPDLDKHKPERLEAAQIEPPARREHFKYTGMTKFLRSFGFAFQGIGYALRTQPNMRVHLGLGLAAVALAVWLGLNLAEWAALLVVMALVYCLEMLNTVVEAIVDLVTEEFHPLAKVAKDVAAGAVLVAAIFALATGLVLFGPRLLALLGSWFGL